MKSDGYASVRGRNVAGLRLQFVRRLTLQCRALRNGRRLAVKQVWLSCQCGSTPRQIHIVLSTHKESWIKSSASVKRKSAGILAANAAVSTAAKALSATSMKLGFPGELIPTQYSAYCRAHQLCPREFFLRCRTIRRLLSKVLRQHAH